MAAKTRSLLIDYYGKDRLGLTSKAIASVINKIESALPQWERLIDISFLDEKLKEHYYDLYRQRRKKLLFGS